MTLNLPILDQVAPCRNLLIAGMGGGFDLFCGLPLYLTLRERGQRVHLANFSFSDVRGFPSGTRLTPTLVGVDATYEGWVVYFPEIHLARWFATERGEAITIWAFHKTGTAPLLHDYQRLIEHLQIDGILLIDGGVDSLVRGDEVQTATVIEDAISLFVVEQLHTVPVRLLACLGLGAEQDLAYPQILENISALIKAGGFWGSCALTPQMAAYRAYEAAVLYTHSQRGQDPSVINASVISAVRGQYGNFHLTAKTEGSHLYISPLMALYWFFELSVVAERNLFLSQLAGTHTFTETVQRYWSARQQIPTRPNHKFFQP